MEQFVQNLHRWKYRRIAGAVAVIGIVAPAFWVFCAIIGYAVGWTISLFI